MEAAVLAIAEGTVEAWRIPEGYEQTREAWLEQIELNPRNTVVLAHAAQAFVHGDLPPAIELFRRARLLYGSKPAWAKQLGFSKSREAPHQSAAARKLSSESLVRLERAFDLSDGDARALLLVDLARAAFKSGEQAKAREFDKAPLQVSDEGRNQGTRTHYGHFTLGKIALARGNREEAE